MGHGARVMSKLRISSSLMLICLIALSLVSIAMPLGSAQTSGTTVQSTIIKQDTTWTKMGSPYTLAGPVAVAAGVTLTLEPGVTLNIANYNLLVNGTMNAKGTEADPIHISGTETLYASLTLNAVGTSGTAGADGVFEHVVFSIKGLVVDGGNLIFRNNQMTGLSIAGGNTLLEGNIIDGSIYTYRNSPQILNNQIYGGISVQGGTPTIKGNNITTTNTYGAPTAGQDQYSKRYSIEIGPTQRIDTSASITNNTIAAGIYSQAARNEITNNTINGGVTFYGSGSTVNANTITGGINILSGGGYYIIENNVISNGSTAGIYMQWGGTAYSGFGWSTNTNSALIQRNLITNSKYGLQLADFAPVQNNTISNSQTAIYLQSANGTFNYNNIVGYTQNSVYIETGQANIDATQNWWGIADAQNVNQTVHDSRYDYNLGTVNILPILTASNPQAMPDPNFTLTVSNSSTMQPTTSVAPQTPEPTGDLQPSSTPNAATPTPIVSTPIASQNQQVDQPNLPQNPDLTQTALVAALAIIVALVGAVAVLARRNRHIKTGSSRDSA